MKTPAVALKVALALLLAAVAFTSWFTPLEDRDFFWHLKTGEWIWQNGTLPSADPFTYTTPADLTVMQRFTLTSYWVSQVTYHLVTQGLGLGGVLLLNLLVVGALLLAVYRGREGDDLVFLGLMVLFLCLLRLFPMERPQAFSFALFAALLAAVARLRGAPAGRRFLVWTAAVACLMLLWANVHGAYLLGQAVLALHAAVDGFAFVRSRPGSPERERHRLLAVAAAIGLAASLLNPNGWNAVAYLRPLPAAVLSANIEYQSPLFLFRELHLESVAVYGLFLLLCIPGLVSRRRAADLPGTAIILLLGLYSIRQSRYLPFFCIAALPVIGRGLSGMRGIAWIRALVVAVACAAGLAVLWENRGNVGTTRRAGWVNESLLPVRAADFVLASQPQGNLFNSYGWGGYLIWRLGPARKVFIDGRNLDDGVFRTYQTVEQAERDPSTGAPRWKAVFNRYQVGVVVMPVFDSNGGVSPLTLDLLDDREWACVLADFTSVVFLRLLPENLPIIEARGMPRESALDLVIGLCGLRRNADPANVATVLSEGDLLLKRGRLSQARALYRIADRLAPGSAAVRQRLEAAGLRAGAPEGVPARPPR